MALPVIVAATALVLSITVAGGTSLHAANAAQIGAEALAAGLSPAEAETLAAAAGGAGSAVQVTTNATVGTVAVTLPAATWWGVIHLTTARSVVLPATASGPTGTQPTGETGTATSPPVGEGSSPSNPVYAPPPTAQPAPWPIFGGPGLGRTVLP